jgi:small subunit ribosomal protein S6
MIYESAYVLRTDASEDAIKKVSETVKETIKEFNGEVLVEDKWGVKTFAQPTESGAVRGIYVYFMYSADANCNAELERRFKINEEVLKFIFINLGTDDKKDALVKAYKNPSHSAEALGDLEKEKKMFSKRKSCYFSAKKTAPDWKDPNSYAWLVNEFGKISPGRVTGLRPKFQRMATTAIKRGRCMGLISYMSNQTAR